MSQSFSQPFGPKHPAFSKFLQTPEILLGVGGLFFILYATFTYLLSPLTEAGTKLGTDIQTEQSTLQKNKDTKAKIERLKTEAEANPTAMLALDNGEIDSVKVNDFIQSLQAYSNQNSLNLPMPHNEIEIVEIKDVTSMTPAATGGTTPPPAPGPEATGASTPSGINIFSNGVAPFSLSELADLNLNVQAHQYRYQLELVGTYIGLIDYVRKISQNSPFVGIRSVTFSLDDNAPNILKFVPALTENKTTPPNTGKGDEKAQKAFSVSRVKTGAPVRLVLELDVFLKTPAVGAGTPAGTTGADPSAMAAPAPTA
jgi:hypothetical protein